MEGLGNQKSEGELGKEGSWLCCFRSGVCYSAWFSCVLVKKPTKNPQITEGGGEEDVICLSQLYLKLILNVSLLRARKFLQLPAVNNWDAFSSQLTYRGW